MKYDRLKTTTGDQLELGTRIRQSGTPMFGQPMAAIEGTITKMEDCDSGIFLHVRRDDGSTGKAHVRYVIPHGVQMRDHGITVEILQQVPRQLEIRA